MLRPKLTVLDEPLLDRIMCEAFDLLDNPGVRVHNAEALELLAQAGAQVDFNAQVARLSQEMVSQALRSVPAEFDLYDLPGQAVVHYGGDQVHFDPGSAGISVLIDENGAQRPPVTADFVRFVQLVELLPQIDAQSTAMVCRDVVPEIGDLYRLYVALNHMRKPIVTGAFRKDTWWAMREMLVTARGGVQQLKAQPLAVFDICPSPPLLWSDLTCQNLIDCAHSFIPAELVSMPLAGATAPVTLAGAVVQHTAESLSGVIIHQLAQPGAPLVWGGSPAAFDMRAGTTPMGAAETWLIDAACAQVGKSLHLPTHAYMGMSDAKLLDAQCGLESMGGALSGALAGINMISGAGMLDFETCLSCEKLVIDAEMIGLVQRVIAGVTAREESLAVGLLRQVGHAGDFLTHSHTRRWFRQEQYLPSAVIDRGSLDAWEQQGRPTTYQRAAARVKKLLEKPNPAVLGEAVLAELRRITLAEAQRFGMHELPDVQTNPAAP